jgi:PTS system nitrogen regulatory IIA component
VLQEFILEDGSRKLFNGIDRYTTPLIEDFDVSTVEIDPQRLLEALMERERLGTTGIGHGIAIPHARMAELKRLVGLFARLDEPVDFEALDDQPSDLIFLLLAPDSADADSLKALARIARVLRDPTLQQRLRHEPDRNAVYRMLTQKPESHAA